MGNSLTAGDIFTTVAVFQALRIALIMMPLAANNYLNVRARCDRIQNYILTEDDSTEQSFIHNAEKKQVYTHTTQKHETNVLTPSGSPSTAACMSHWDPQLVFALEDASLSWLEGSPPVLTGVNLEVRSGQVVAVAGEVGSGKT